jgi:tRNA threonylcarbamoyladenosine biosynthesis protein TsaB
MNILAIDTSSSWCSVAFLMGDKDPIFRHEESGSSASQILLPWIQALMHEHQIGWQDVDAIAVSQGPGAFTGVRLGVGVAQGLAMANSKPLIPVPSLDGIANYSYYQKDPAWLDDGFALVAIDARMDEVYWVIYQTSKDHPPVRQGDIKLSSIVDMDPQLAHLFVGNAFSVYQSKIITDVLPLKANAAKQAWIFQADLQPHALGIAYSARALSDQGVYLPQDCQPLYIRDKVAQTTAEREAIKRSALSNSVSS